MRDVVSYKCKQCDNRAYYNFNRTERPSFCSEHMTFGMKNVYTCTCIKCHRCTVQKRTDYLCSDCNPNAARHIGHHERQVQDWLAEAFPGLYIAHNQMIGGSTLSRVTACVRPDFVIKMNNIPHVIEVDENSHAHYNYTVEHKHMLTITRLFGANRIVFIRYNPSCFLIDGCQASTPINEDERRTLLVSVVQNYLDHAMSVQTYVQPIISMTVHYLYYNTKMFPRIDTSESHVPRRLNEYEYIVEQEV